MKPILSILVLCFGFSLISNAATYCVRSEATGNNSGLDWENAWTELPEVLERGATYYIAGGSYPSYIFDDAEQGETCITIKKATNKVTIDDENIGDCL